MCLLGSDGKSAPAEQTSDFEMEHEFRQMLLHILATSNAFPTEERKNDVSESFIKLNRYSTRQNNNLSEMSPISLQDQENDQ